MEHINADVIFETNKRSTEHEDVAEQIIRFFAENKFTYADAIRTLGVTKSRINEAAQRASIQALLQ